MFIYEKNGKLNLMIKGGAPAKENEIPNIVVGSDGNTPAGAKVEIDGKQVKTEGDSPSPTNVYDATWISNATVAQAMEDAGVGGESLVAAYTRNSSDLSSVSDLKNMLISKAEEYGIVEEAEGEQRATFTEEHPCPITTIKYGSLSFTTTDTSKDVTLSNQESSVVAGQGTALLPVATPIIAWGEQDGKEMFIILFNTSVDSSKNSYASLALMKNVPFFEGAPDGSIAVALSFVLKS